MEEEDGETPGDSTLPPPPPKRVRACNKSKLPTALERLFTVMRIANPDFEYEFTGVDRGVLAVHGSRPYFQFRVDQDTLKVTTGFDGNPSTVGVFPCPTDTAKTLCLLGRIVYDELERVWVP